jgi:hypothetical protein
MPPAAKQTKVFWFFFSKKNVFITRMVEVMGAASLIHPTPAALACRGTRVAVWRW